MPLSIQVKLPVEDKDFHIDGQKLIYHDTMMELPEIVGFTFGRSENKLHGITNNIHYYLHFIDTSGDEIKVDFAWNILSWNSEETYRLMTSWTWHYLAGQIHKNIHQALVNGIPFDIGQLRVNGAGITFLQKPLPGQERERFIRWEDLRHETGEDAIVVRSLVEPDADFTQSLRAYNARVFAAYLDTLRQQPDLIRQFKK